MKNEQIKIDNFEIKINRPEVGVGSIVVCEDGLPNTIYRGNLIGNNDLEMSFLAKTIERTRNYKDTYKLN